MNINIYDSKINEANGLPNPPATEGQTQNLDIQDIMNMIKQGDIAEATALLHQAGIEVISNTVDGVTIIEFKFNNQSYSVRSNPPSDDVDDSGTGASRVGAKGSSGAINEEEVLGRFVELWEPMLKVIGWDSDVVRRLAEFFQAVKPEELEKLLPALGAKDIGSNIGAAFLPNGFYWCRENYAHRDVFHLQYNRASMSCWVNADWDNMDPGTMTLEEYFNSPEGAWLKTPEELVNEYKNNPCDDTNMFENGAFVRIIEYFGIDKAQEYLDAYKEAFFDESKGDYLETIELNGEKYFRLSFNGEEHCYDSHCYYQTALFRDKLSIMSSEPIFSFLGYDNPVISQLSNDEGKTIGELDFHDWAYGTKDSEELFKILYKNGAEYTVSYTADNKYAILDVNVNGETAQITMPKDFYLRYSLEYHLPEETGKPAAINRDNPSSVGPTSHEFSTKEFQEIIGRTGNYVYEMPVVEHYVDSLSEFMGLEGGDWYNKREHRPLVSADYIMEFLTTGYVDNWADVEEFQSDIMEYERQTVYAALSAILKMAGVENVDKIDFDNLKNENIEQQLGVRASDIEAAIKNFFKDMSFDRNSGLDVDCYGYNLFVCLYENGYDDKYFEDYINTHINKKMLDQMVIDQAMGNGIETKVPEMEEVVNAGLDVQQTVGQDVADNLVSEDGVHLDDDSVDEAIEQAREELRAEIEGIAKDAGVDDVDAFVDNMVEDVKNKINTIRAYFEAIIKSHDFSNGVLTPQECAINPIGIIWHNDLFYDTEYKVYGKELDSVMLMIRDYFIEHPIENLNELDIVDCIRYFFNRHDFNSAAFSELFSNYSIGFKYADLLKVIFDRYIS